MKKIITLLITIFVVIVISGCMRHNDELYVPSPIPDAKMRLQKINPKIVDRVASKGRDEYLMVIANRRFATPFKCKIAYNMAKDIINKKKYKNDINFALAISKYLYKKNRNCVKPRGIEIAYLGYYKYSHKEFYNLLKSVILEVHKIFKNRDKFIYKHNSLALLRPENIDKINIAIIHNYNHLTARYFPVGNIVYSGINFYRLKKDKIYRAELAFLTAHEMVHAYAMHTSEIMTQKTESDIVTEVILNQIYKLLSPSTRQILDGVAEFLAKGLLTKADYDYDNKIVEERMKSSKAKIFIKLGQKDKLEFLGINLEIPQTTKLVLMELINRDKEDSVNYSIIRTITTLLSPNSQNLMIEAGSHAKAQEFEADALGLRAIKELHYNTNDALKIFEEEMKQEKQKETLIYHPSLKERLLKLKKLGI